MSGEVHEAEGVAGEVATAVVQGGHGYARHNGLEVDMPGSTVVVTSEKAHVNWWGLVLPALVVIAGWGIVHKLNSARDLSIKRRDTRVQYLIEAYRRIESAAGRHLDNPQDEDQVRCRRDFEDALGDIQLFGSDDHIGLATKMAESLVATKRVDADLMDELLVSLRRDLRDELELPQADDPLVHLRINLSRASPPSLPPGGR